MKKLTFILFILISGNALYAQKLILKARLTDGEGMPLANATIRLSQAGNPAAAQYQVSDTSGAFLFAALPGSYRLTISYLGKELMQRPLTLEKDTDWGRLQVAPGANTLSAVTVKGQAPLLVRTADRFIMNVERNPLAAGMSVWELLPMSPGVITGTDGEILLNGKNGVRVMVNDKLLRLTGPQLINFLSGLRAEDIRSIEIMAHPPAGFDAEGTGGIIRINMRRLKTDGLETSLSATYRQGRYARYLGNTGINYKSGKWLWFASGGANEWNSYFNRYTERLVQGNPVAVLTQSNYLQGGHGYNYRGGLEYTINDRQSVTLQADGSRGRDASSSAILTRLIRNKELDTLVNGSYPDRSFSNNHSFNLSYLNRLDTLGRTIKWVTDYSAIYNNNQTEYLNSYYNGLGSFIRQLDRRGEVSDGLYIYTGQLDYTHPLGQKRGVWEAGIKFSGVNTANANNFYLFDSNTKGWVPDPGQTNAFRYREQVYAAYTSFSSNLKKLEYSGGLRVEYTHAQSRSVTTGERFNQNYTRLFPNIFFRMPVNKSGNQYINLSYNKRITRPAYILLNPFRYQTDEYSLKSGNPFLQPSVGHSLELGYTLNSSLSLSLGYDLGLKRIGDEEQRIGNYTIVSFANISRSNEFNLNIYWNYAPAKWWNMTNNISAGYSHFRGNAGYNEGTAQCYFFTNQQISPGKNWTIILNGNFSTKGVDRYYRSLVNYAVFNLGIQKKMMKGQMIAKTGINDIFYRNGYRRLLMEYQGQYNLTKTNWDTRQIYFSLNYNVKKGARINRNEIQKSNSPELQRAN